MMQHQVNVSARFNPETNVCHGAPSWFCGVPMNMEAATDAQNINIELTAASPRSVDCLVSWQLVDVAHVAICQSVANITTNPRLSAKEENDDEKSIAILVQWRDGALGRREGSRAMSHARTTVRRYLKDSATTLTKRPVVFRHRNICSACATQQNLSFPVSPEY